MIKSKCSNCGKENEYEDKLWMGREITLCNYCRHTLSICHWFGEINEEIIKNAEQKV